MAHASGLQCLWQFLICHGKAILVTLEAVVCHQFQVLSGFQFDLATCCKEACADLGTLGVQQDRDWFVWTHLICLANPVDGCLMRWVVAMREVQACNIHAGIDELAEILDRPTSWAHGTNDLALPAERISCLLLHAHITHAPRQEETRLSIPGKLQFGGNPNRTWDLNHLDKVRIPIFSIDAGNL